MALTPTTNIPLGFEAPDFTLKNVIDGKTYCFSDLKGMSGTLVMFICNHCPYVIHVQDELIRLANDYLSSGIGFIAISSNDIVHYPEDAPDKMRKLALANNYPFPYLYDETQEVARAYEASCTPDFALFDKNNICVYRGQLDGSSPGNDYPVDGCSMRETFELMLNGKPISEENQKPSLGCGIKWKKE